MPTINDLRTFQNYPLDMKLRKTQLRIREWVSYYGTSGVYVSFSGGKDSTVLLHIVRQMYPDIEAVFVDTGLEYPEIRSFVKTFDNVTVLRPKMRFDDVIRKYGYPIIGKKQADTISGAKNQLKKGVYSLRLMELGVSIDEAKELGLKLPGDEMLKRYTATCEKSKFTIPNYKPLLFNVDFDVSPYCCIVMKKAPMYEFEKRNDKVPITAQTAAESMVREAAWLKNGCNAFNAKHAISNPMSFWTEQDILSYAKYHNLRLASVYGDIVHEAEDGLIYENTLLECGKLCTTGCDRTGCIFCGFGAHLSPKNKESRFERLKRTHPRQYEYCLEGGAYDADGLWKPTKEGLGMQHVFDTLNEIYGNGFIRY